MSRSITPPSRFKEDPIFDKLNYVDYTYEQVRTQLGFCRTCFETIKPGMSGRRSSLTKEKDWALVHQKSNEALL